MNTFVHGFIFRINMKLSDILQDIIFPPNCIICGKYLGLGTRPLICSSCEEQYSAFNGNCSRCGSTFDFSGAMPLCHTCRSARHPFDGVISAYFYKDGVRRTIIEHKFSFYRNHSIIFAGSLNSALEKLFGEEKPDFIVSVPPDKKRLNTRGYDPVFEIASALSKLSDIPFRYDILEKIKSTPNQSLLAYRARLKNVRGCFKVTDKDAVKGKNILLIDDVFTTGATCGECAKMLKKAGAAYVLAVTVSISERFKK